MREREGRKRVKKRKGSGEGVAQRTDDVVVTHPKSLQLSLSSQQRAGPERKQNGQASNLEGGRGNCGARSQPYSVACVRFFPPAHFCIIAIFSSATTISYPLNPGRGAWKLAASAASNP